MIIVYHKNNKVTKIINLINKEEIKVGLGNIQQCLLFLAEEYKNTFIAWSHKNLENCLNFKEWDKIALHPLKMVSFETGRDYYIDNSIGFIEQAPFIKVNKKVEYPTWLMSSDVGFIHASSLIKFQYLLSYKLTFNFFLNIIAKAGMKNGLLCYSNPFLLKNGFPKINKKTASKTEIFQFIKSNYKFRWVFLYLFNQLIYRKQFLGLPLLISFFKRPISTKVTFSSSSSIHIINTEEKIVPAIDVIIPTLGREIYLKNVLNDLANQKLLPKKVIIIEQNLVKGTTSKLEFLSDKWPFKIDHTLIYKLGACNARNIGLKKVTSDWIFFADDDIRLKEHVLEDSFKYINLYHAKAVTISCLQKNEIERNRVIYQWPTFGTNASIIKSDVLKNTKFDMAFEFGYGEDSDFGMQLRNIGTDILYVPFVSMLHLKAPIGGFRKKIKQKWELETIQPKPSPTVMVFKLKHAIKEQLQGYKTTLFFKFYKVQPIKNPFKYFEIMKKRWNKSLFWANYLIKKYSNEI